MLVEVESADGSVARATVHARRRSYLAAIAPAVLAASDLAMGRGPAAGLVPHDRQVEPADLIALLQGLGMGIAFSKLPSAPAANAGLTT